jgi:membrane protease YdiL (CAAX protease family)
MTTTQQHSTTDPIPGAGAPSAGRMRAAVAVFLALAFGLSWLSALPLWLDGGLTNPVWPVIAVAMMTTPTIAALVATLAVLRPAHPARFLGLAPLRRSALTFGAIGVGGAVLISALAIALGVAVGVGRLTPASDTGAQLLMLPVLTVLVGITAIGEEIGWRGFLLPALQPLGTVPSLLINGVVWGAWHAPLLLLGYNYVTTSPISLPLMMVSTALIGTLLAWLRFRSGSIWAGALAHGAMNASVSVLLAAFVPSTPDVAMTTLGWAGWAVLAVTITAIGIAGGFRGMRFPSAAAADRPADAG